MTTRLELEEWRTTSGVALSTSQRDALLSFPIAIRPAPGEGMYDLTPGSHVGTIELPGLSIRIRPKLAIDRLAFLLSYSLDGLKLMADDTELARDPDLFEFVAAAFAAEVRRAFRLGLLQGYRTEDDALMTVRGRIAFDRQIRRFGITPPVEVTYDDFTTDIIENRLIRAALNRLGRIRIRSRRTRRNLGPLTAALTDVSLVEYGTDLPTVRFTRLNQRYRPALRLAELILGATSVDPGRGSVLAPSFLIDMNVVFEDFVVTAIREALGLTERELVQGAKGKKLHLDMARTIPLKPDISWWRGKSCLAVADVKYKKTIDQRVPNADLYQILAYATATDLPDGMLIYAAGEEDPAVHEVRFSGKRLTVVALDLAGDQRRLLRRVAGLAEHLVPRSDIHRTA